MAKQKITYIEKLEQRRKDLINNMSKVDISSYSYFILNNKLKEIQECEDIYNQEKSNNEEIKACGIVNGL